MRSLILLSLVAVLNGCGKFDAEAMFRAHATSVEHDEVRNLRGGKVSCLHCPMYFAFDSEPEVIASLVSKHKLKSVSSMTPETLQLEELVEREEAWWKLPTPSTSDKIYWVRYSPKQPGLDPAFRLLILRSNKAFFITSGHFEHENYSVSDA